MTVPAPSPTSRPRVPTLPPLEEQVERLVALGVADLASQDRTPLTLAEGVHWVLQTPDVLERNHCFMTAGSRRVRARARLDARTPALWISNGTGRDGRARRDAPKVGRCWAGNRHTWLGFASALGRRPLVG